MEGKGISFIILLVIVALLSLTLAGLAFYVFITAGSTSKSATETASNKESVKVVPKDDELGVMELFKEKRYFNLKQTDDKKMSVISISGAELQYFVKGEPVKGLKAADIKKKVEAKKKEIIELMGTYFQNITVEEIKLPDAKEKAKKELTNRINELLNHGEKEKDKKEYAYTVIFEEWFYQ